MALTPADIEIVKQQYELLATEMLRRERAGKPITFYHYMIDDRRSLHLQAHFRLRFRNRIHGGHAVGRSVSLPPVRRRGGIQTRGYMERRDKPGTARGIPRLQCLRAPRVRRLLGKACTAPVAVPPMPTMHPAPSAAYIAGVRTVPQAY